MPLEGIAVRLRCEKVTTLSNKCETDLDSIKLQISSTKLQINSKSQYPMTKTKSEYPIITDKKRNLNVVTGVQLWLIPVLLM
jgi:hypothetical protein